MQNILYHCLIYVGAQKGRRKLVDVKGERTGLIVDHYVSCVIYDVCIKEVHHFTFFFFSFNEVG